MPISLLLLGLYLVCSCMLVYLLGYMFVCSDFSVAIRASICLYLSNLLSISTSTYPAYFPTCQPACRLPIYISTDLSSSLVCWYLLYLRCHTYLSIYLSIYLYLYICVYLYTYIYIYTHYLFICLHAFIYVRTESYLQPQTATKEESTLGRFEPSCCVTCSCSMSTAS